MKHSAIVAAGALLLATTGGAGSAVAQDRYGPPSPPCRDGGPRDSYGVCVCDYEADFYNPPAPWHVVRAGGPGIRIRGRPITIASGRIDIQGPPIYVEAPPIRIQAPQIYLRAPEVHVRPADVIVEPPEIHFEGCPDGRDCEAIAPARHNDGERG